MRRPLFVLRMQGRKGGRIMHERRTISKFISQTETTFEGGDSLQYILFQELKGRYKLVLHVMYELIIVCALQNMESTRI